MASILSLSPELRLEIYSYIFTFDCPLRRQKSITEQDGTLLDSIRQIVSGRPADISVIFARKTTFAEALPILYIQNTISLCHDDVCVLTRPPGLTRIDAKLMRQAVVVDWTECGPWSRCERCLGEIGSSFSGFEMGRFPKMRKVTFDLEGFEGGYEALRAKMAAAGIEEELKFTAVGRLGMKH